MDFGIGLAYQIPNWLTSSDTYGQSDGIEYITVAYTDSSGDTSVRQSRLSIVEVRKVALFFYLGPM